MVSPNKICSSPGHFLPSALSQKFTEFRAGWGETHLAPKEHSQSSSGVRLVLSLAGLESSCLQQTD